MGVTSRQIISKLRGLSNSDIAGHSQRFFKTGKGEYGEGDRFLGIRVPVLRKCVKEFYTISLEDTLELLQSNFHEIRLLALLIMVKKYSTARSKSEEKKLYDTYLANTKHINNWDLVDSSAHHIVGAHLYPRSRRPLYRLARSASLWERRIGIMSTYDFVKKGDFAETLKIAEILLDDPEDLIQKAVGWMLREIGNRDRETEEGFLREHYQKMPRTMLRYAIEKFPDETRLGYLKGAI